LENERESMRITSELLMRIARDTVSQRTRTDRDVLAVYLHGSLLMAEPLLGGATDIDLFFIHNNGSQAPREIVRMTDDVHLDIAHHSRSLYRQARDLRLEPWLGSAIYGCKILFDPQHFMDFTQASVRGHFNNPENILARTQKQASRARSIWLNFQMEPVKSGLSSTQLYLEAIEQAANALACLTGPPLPIRRLTSEFAERAQALNRPGLYPGLLGLLGAAEVQIEQLRNWLPDWQAAIQALPKHIAGARLHPHRIHYYRVAIEEALAGDHPYACIWPLLSTWSEAVSMVEQGEQAMTTWHEAMQQLGLIGEKFPDRLDALDAYLDLMEETIEDWARARGVGESSDFQI
jgi:hypothetical protein